MKKAYALVLAVLLAVPFAASAQAGEIIRSFNVEARLEANRRLTVTEGITYDFGTEQRHGIYRVIPERYERPTGNYNYRYTVVGVTRNGEAEPYETSREDGSLRIGIGDADAYVTGQQVYVITYTTDRAINFFDGEGELYWNVTGNEWEVPIISARMTLIGPEGFDAAAAPERVLCFTGPVGSTGTECEIGGNGNDGELVISALRPFGASDGLTFAVRFPPGLIVEPTLLDQVMQVVRDNGILFLPVATLVIMLWLWWMRGKDPEGRGTIVPQYDPPRAFTPAEMAALRDQDVPQRAITATMLDLARRGYLTIEFGEEKGWLSASPTYAFLKAKPADAALSDAERTIHDQLFETSDRVELKDLKGSFHKCVKTFNSQVMTGLTTRKYFVADPIKVRAAYVGSAVAVIFAIFWLLGAFLNPLTSVALVVSAAIVAAVGWHMPAKTREGAIALEEVDGFKWFLSVTEKDRLAFHNAPSRKPEQFHAFLPFAVAFAVEEQWAEQFKGIEIPPPNYASGAVLHHWSAVNFAHSLGSLNSAAASSAYAAPSSAGSGGSGFSGGGSGGGGGGGGGGSW